MRVATLSLALASTAHALRFFPVEQHPLRASLDRSPLVVWSDELGLADTSPVVLPTQPHVYPSPSAAARVVPVLETLDIGFIEEKLTEFTSFTTRHYLTEGGRSSQKWLLRQIKGLIKTTPSKAPASVQEFKHVWLQNSIIARINGSDPDAGVVILGAHLDSSNHEDVELTAPGADDDGSGSIAVLEVFRGLLAANFTPARTMEFHWYSAEEAGLYGSDAVATDYRRRNVMVHAQLQFDMLAWVKNGTEPEVGVFTNWADEGLVELQKQLVSAYLTIPYAESKIPGNAGSDHMPWTRQGYPAACVSEGRWEHINLEWIHTPNDRMNISEEFSVPHILDFAKLGVAYAMEVAG